MKYAQTSQLRPNDVILMSLLLILNIFYTFSRFYIFYKIYLPHPFLQWLFVHKTIKMNIPLYGTKWIYHYITVNTKNMTTEIVKGLKTDSE